MKTQVMRHLIDIGPSFRDVNFPVEQLLAGLLHFGLSQMSARLYSSIVTITFFMSYNPA